MCAGAGNHFPSGHIALDVKGLKTIHAAPFARIELGVANIKPDQASGGEDAISSSAISFFRNY
jgi:hypothetical protein